jgi:hypothetical protein
MNRFTCRTKKCFWRQTVNSHLVVLLEYMPISQLVGVAVAGWQKSKKPLPLSREFIAKLPIPNYPRSPARVRCCERG